MRGGHRLPTTPRGSGVHEELLASFRGCLIGVAVGDALGAPFEGHSQVDDEAWESVSQGRDRLRFTDDTSMTFGVVEGLLAADDFDGDLMARIFIRDYEAEPWRGFGPGPPHVFEKLKTGARWSDAAREAHAGEGSFGNGAAMRVAPVGLRFFRDLDRVAEEARNSALITHAHPLGRDGAVAQAVAVACAVAAEPPLDQAFVVDAILDHVEVPEMRQAIDAAASLGASEPRQVAATLGNGITAIEAVPAALAAFLANADSFSDTISFAVAIGGDTDTIASMAGALSGAYLDGAIPRPWTNRVEGARSMKRLGSVMFESATGLYTA